MAIALWVCLGELFLLLQGMVNQSQADEIFGGEIFRVGLKSIKTILGMTPLSHNARLIFSSSAISLLPLSPNFPVIMQGDTLEQRALSVSAHDPPMLAITERTWNALGLGTVLWIWHLKMSINLNEKTNEDFMHVDLKWHFGTSFPKLPAGHLHGARCL